MQYHQAAAHSVHRFPRLHFLRVSSGRPCDSYEGANHWLVPQVATGDNAIVESDRRFVSHDVSSYSRCVHTHRSSRCRMATKAKQVQTFGRKRNAVAVALCKEGKGHIRLNGSPLHLVEPQILRVKTMEPVRTLKPRRKR